MWKRIKKYFEIISQDDIDYAIREACYELTQMYILYKRFRNNMDRRRFASINYYKGLTWNGYIFDPDTGKITSEEDYVKKHNPNNLSIQEILELQKVLYDARNNAITYAIKKLKP